ncbi:MAG: hydroxyacid dehydrogenase [Candidatus Omnitrophica bacterium CG11_big_fil_rev_8_21_14_0_20_64_10]|nr:MAG: hydroxyacid dehydrogenase [Candidatus Omnitrophica bacterium CG11_big_fil_rev_8_21_14_0_20_64_10]
MDPVKAVFFETEPWEKRYLTRALKGTGVVPRFVREPLLPQTLAEARGAGILSVFIYSKLDRALIRKLKGVRLIVTRSTGFDHIDLAACRSAKIQTANVPFYGENTVAEHTFALILALSRNVHKAYVRTVRGDFSLTGLQGFDLKGRTIGVVGTGRIGLHVIKMAKGFGMEVLAHDIRRDSFLSEVLDFRYVDLPELLAGSDIVSLHLPANPSTRHIMNRKIFAQMKRGALLINTARGSLVETNALVEALDDGIVGGAGLDVLEGEELVKEERQLLEKDFPKEKLVTLLQNNILLHRDNVVITPHIAFDSREALERILETTAENIRGFLRGRVPHPIG